jgi:hypothetical protein
MARVTHVKKAQQRYETVPVIDEATGEQKVTPVMGRDGEQKVSKRGPVFMRVTMADKTKPLPPLECDFNGCDITDGKILPGQAYQHITPKSGPYGGRQRSRHEAHPSWQIWEYSYSVSAQAAQVQNDMHETIDGFEFTDVSDFDALRDEVAEMADAFVSDREEALSNMPEGLQDGSQAQEYVEMAESWKDEIEQASVPDGGTEEDCADCDGTGKDEVKWFVNGPDNQSLSEDGFDSEDEANAALADHLEANEDDDEDDWSVEQGDNGEDCEICEGTGTAPGMSEDWIEEAKDAIREAVDGCEI